MVSVPVKRTPLPTSFKVGSVNPLTVHSHRLVSPVGPGYLIYGFNSSKPVECIVKISMKPVWWSQEPDDFKVITKVSGYGSYDVVKLLDRRVVSFHFETDPDTVAEVTLKAVNYPLFKTYSDHNETLCMGVDAARAFLLLNDVDVGKYLEHSTEYGSPNYYWRKKLEYDNVANLLYHNLPEPCEYVSIRFEQKHRPGHYYEVWVTLGTNQIIGGGECR